MRFPVCWKVNFAGHQTHWKRLEARKERSCQSFSASHIAWRADCSFHRPTFSRPGINCLRTFFFFRQMVFGFHPDKFQFSVQWKLCNLFYCVISCLCNNVGLGFCWFKSNVTLYSWLHREWIKICIPLYCISLRKKTMVFVFFNLGWSCKLKCLIDQGLL